MSAQNTTAFIESILFTKMDFLSSLFLYLSFGISASVYFVSLPFFLRNRRSFPISSIFPVANITVVTAAFSNSLFFVLFVTFPEPEFHALQKIALHVAVTSISTAIGGLLVIFQLVKELIERAREKVARRRGLERSNTSRNLLLHSSHFLSHRRVVHVLLGWFCFGIIFSSCLSPLDVLDLSVTFTILTGCVTLVLLIGVIRSVRGGSDSIGLKKQIVTLALVVMFLGVVDTGMSTVAASQLARWQAGGPRPTFSMTRTYWIAPTYGAAMTIVLLLWPAIQAHRNRRQTEEEAVQETPLIEYSSSPSFRKQSTLPQVLEDPNLCHEFEDFLASEFSVENLHFILACDALTEADLKTVTKFLRIYSEFIDLSASNQVNLPANLFEALTRVVVAMATRENIPQLLGTAYELLRSARAEIFNLLQRDSFRRFTRA